MPYSIDWYIKDEIIYIYYSGTTTISELHESLTTTIHMIESSPRYLVHIISDVGDVTKPTNPKESLEVVREVGTHERAGWNIILREKSILMKIGIAFGTSIFKSRNRAFDTLEEAQKFLSEIDQNLHWDQANQSVIHI